MSLKRYIISLGVFILLATGFMTVRAQEYVAIVCAGDTGRAYYVQGTEGSTFEWNVEGGVISRNYGDSIIVDWGMVSGEYTLSVQEISQYGCYSEPKQGTVLVSAPDLELGDDAYICQGETFTLTAIGDFYSYLWPDGSTGQSYRTSTEEVITCVVTDQYGCFWEDDLFLEVKELPEIDLGEDTSLCGDQVLYLNGGFDGEQYLWSTDEQTPEIAVNQGYKEIWVQVTDQDGCENSDTIVINNCDPGLYFSDIPTAITPNGDGKNDTWEIEKLESFPDAVIDIYDRWGRLIWRSEPGYPNPWNGKDMNGRDVPMDSYHFIILLNFGDDDRVIGAVTVIK